MTEKIREQTSAIMDGEIDTRPCGESIKSEEFKNTWFRYHLISDCMHKRHPLYHDFTLTQKISESIQSEPTVLAPVSQPVSRFLKPAAGLAVAASVAAMAIFGVQQLQTLNDDPVGQPVPIAQTAVPADNIEFGVPVQLPESGTIRPVQAQMQSDMRINRYLLNHNEYRTSMGVGGVSPHVRLVATGSDE